MRTRLGLGKTAGTGSAVVTLKTFTLSGTTYMVTPGGCTDSTTPTCDGGTDRLSKSWGSTGTTTSAISTTDGSGNTAKIVALDNTASAAKYCSDITYGGYNDWFLPAKDQLNAMYLNRVAI